MIVIDNVSLSFGSVRALVEDLTVWQNLFLNREFVHRIGPLAVLDKRGMQKQAREMVSTLAVNVPAGFSSRLVIMDEPTAALGVQETARVEELILRLRDEGHAVLLISHNFAQVMRLSDQVWVMRAGRCVGGRRTEATTGEEIVALITGALNA